MFGNRGILHDDGRTIVRHWVGRAWVSCDPSFKGIDRKPLFQPHRYSELFFLDEATAFAVGHRPCKYCQYVRFQGFKDVWAKTFVPEGAAKDIRVRDIDAQLHQDRAVRGGGKVTFVAPLSELPEGTMIEVNDSAILLYRHAYFYWSFNGYSRAESIGSGTQVKVLTPMSFVRLYASGFTPRVHSSADA